MRAAPLPAELQAAAPELGRRFAVILRGLYELIAAGFYKDPKRHHLIVPLCFYIDRTSKRLVRLMAHLAAGTLRLRKPHPGRKPGTPPIHLPRKRAWLLVSLQHRTAHFANLLENLLLEPQAAAIIAATPQAQRLLRSLCHMLGIRPPALARPPAPRSPRKVPARATPRLPTVQAAIPLRLPRPAPATSPDQPPPIPWEPPAHGPPPCPHLRHRWPRAAPRPTEPTA